MTIAKEVAAPQDAANNAAQAQSANSGKSKARCKTTRGTGSFRPGMTETTEQTALAKTLTFTVPAKDGLTSDTEIIAVRNLAMELSAAGNLGIAMVGFNDNAWVVSLDIQAVATDKGKYDEALSDTFKAMDATIKASPVLTNGFVTQPRPNWAFVIGGDFVSDSGSL